MRTTSGRKVAWLSIAGALIAGVAAQAAPMRTADPASEGFSAPALAAIGRDSRRQIAAGQIPGAIALVARDGKLVYLDVAGFQDVEHKVPLRRDTILRLHSMTKPVVAVAAMILVEQGKLSLDDPVSKYAPAFAHTRVYVSGEGDAMRTEPLPRPILVRHLLTNTSGITNQGLGDTPVHRLYAQRDVVVATSPSLAVAVDQIAALPLLFQPGENWEYGMSADVLGYVVQQAAGMPLDEFLKQAIFEPLGMKDTAFRLGDDKLNRFWSQYERTPEGLRLVHTPADSPWRGRRTTPSGSGGLISTADDYLRFAQMLANGGELGGVRILRPETVRAMRTDHLAPDQQLSSWTGFGGATGFGYGLAVERDVRARCVSGSNGTFFWSGSEQTFFWVDPDTHIVGMWLSQVTVDPFEWSQDNVMRRLTYAAFKGPPEVFRCRK